MAVFLTLNTPVKYIKGIGEARAAALQRLGVETVEELLGFYPRTYEERGRVIPIADGLDGELCSVIVTVKECSAPKYVRGNLSVFRCKVQDNSSDMELVFFNTPYLAKSLTRGRSYRAYGRIKIGPRGREMVSPKLEPLIKGKELDYYCPVYRITSPLTQRGIASAVSEVLHLCDQIPEILPASVRSEHNIPTRAQAIRIMHRPKSRQELALARKALALTELSVFRLALTSMRCQVQKADACALRLKNTAIKEFFSSLPFSLTKAQQRAVKEIFADLAQPRPMARLLQGDVGSGKTAVAAAAIYLCVKNGYQACIMAPTEILAAQHQKTINRFLSPFGIKTRLLTSGMPTAEKKQVRAGLADGSINVAVGTHALITDKTQFLNCALTVVDEQHRFGVKQRAELLKKSQFNGNQAHMLVMSATPIPRSLSLIIFGDLDVSLLDELPPGRQKITTKVVNASESEKIYQLIRKEIAEGGQAYIVCPLIEEGEEPSDRRGAQDYYNQLTSEHLKGIPAGLLHGKMKPEEKERVMNDFANGTTKLLVSTTVIEVGVDVPDATVMVIENAECFGLSQLHQLRGRIGRGTRSSVCVLVCGKTNPDIADRMSIMRNTSDGFKVAEADLQRRGPGDFFGVRQSGEFSFACSSITDITLLPQTESIVNSAKENPDNPEFKPLFAEAEKFLERTSVALTVN